MTKTLKNFFRKGTKMNQTLKASMDIIRNVSIDSEIKTKNKMDLLESRIARCAYQPTLLKFAEELMRAMQTPASAIRQEKLQPFLCACSSTDANSVKKWLLEYSKTASALCFMKSEDYEQAIEAIIVKDALESCGTVAPMRPFDVEISFKCLSPLSHGSDVKMGNATLFRRIPAITDKGGLIDLPYYAGRAFRGQFRDILANDFLEILGFDIGCNSPQIENFFGHILYEGGSLCSGGQAEKAMKGIMGNADSVKPTFIRQWRDNFPALSALGGVLGGNRAISGKFHVSDFRPQCKQWGGSDLDANDLFCWVYGTNRDDDEDRSDGTTAMIYDIECLKPGTVLKGGIDFKKSASDIEKSAVTRGLEIMKKTAYIGAGGAVGQGSVEMIFNAHTDGDLYAEYITSRKNEIIDFMNSFGALVKPKAKTTKTGIIAATADDITENF